MGGSSSYNSKVRYTFCILSWIQYIQHRFFTQFLSFILSTFNSDCSMRHVMTRVPYSLADDFNVKGHSEPLIQSPSSRNASTASTSVEYKDRSPGANSFADSNCQSLDEQNGPPLALNSSAWLNNVLNLGFAGRAAPSTIGAIPLDLEHCSCLAQFQRAWYARRGCLGNWQVYRALYDTCKPLVTKAIALAIVSAMLEFLSLIFVYQLLAYVEAEGLSSSSGTAFSDDASTKSDGRHSVGTKSVAEGLLWVSLLGLCLASNSLLRAQAVYYAKLGSVAMQNTVLAAIMDKVCACTLGTHCHNLRHNSS